MKQEEMSFCLASQWEVDVLICYILMNTTTVTFAESCHSAKPTSSKFITNELVIALVDRIDSI